MYTKPGAVFIPAVIPDEETIWQMKYVFIWFIS